MSDRADPKQPTVLPGIAGHYSSLFLPDGSEDRPFIYLNMVTSVDGKSTVDGSERGLGSDDDKRMMQELRVHADAVINGANTLRLSGATPRVLPAELKAQRKQRGLAPQPIGVIVTRTGELPLDAAFFTSREFDAVVFATTSTPAERVKAIAETGRPVEIVADSPDNAAEIVGILRKRYGVHRLLCEGGATLNAALLRAEVVDQLCITIAPWIVGGADNLTAIEGGGYTRATMSRLSLLQQRYDDRTGEFYLRYAVAYRHNDGGTTRPG